MIQASLRRPDRAAALKQFKWHVAEFVLLVVTVRVAPYVLHLLDGKSAHSASSL